VAGLGLLAEFRASLIEVEMDRTTWHLRAAWMEAPPASRPAFKRLSRRARLNANLLTR
jgi:hypothetical protein